MARTKKEDTVSSYSYFRTLFGDNPEWLNTKSNNIILARYRADHGLAEDGEIDKSVKNNLANLKSIMRKKAREEGQTRPARAETNSRKGGSRLDALEEMIDECLTLAKNQDREALQDVIGLLRRARNEVVWKMGQA